MEMNQARESIIAYELISPKVLVYDSTDEGVSVDYKKKVYTYNNELKCQQIENEDYIPCNLVEVTKGMLQEERKTFLQGVLTPSFQNKLNNRLFKKIDRLTLNILIENCVLENIHSCTGAITPFDISRAFSFIESHSNIACKVIVHPIMYAYIRVMPQFEPASSRDFIMTGLCGHIFGADVHLTVEMASNKILITGISTSLGVLQAPCDFTEWTGPRKTPSDNLIKKYEYDQQTKIWLVTTTMNVVIADINSVALVTHSY